MVALDIGAGDKKIIKNYLKLPNSSAPGSWCQVLSELIIPENSDDPKQCQDRGYILGVDILVGEII